MLVHTFRDFDAFADSVRAIDAVMMLQNPARRSWSVKQAFADGIEVQIGQLGSGNIAEGQSWKSGTVIYMPLSHEVEYSANGRVLGRDELMVLEPGGEFCVSTKSAHDWCSILIPTDKPVPHGAPAKPSTEPPTAETARFRVARANWEIADRFRSAVSQVMVASANAPHFKSSPAAKIAARELTEVASFITGRPQTGASNHLGRPAVSRQAIISSCRDLIEELAGRDIRVADLAAKAGVSERTLRQAFHDYYGVGPVRYLQFRQLHQVHRALQEADPGTIGVGDVLVQHGIWEFGRFAARHRRLFGELPSQTLRKTTF